MYEAEEAEDIAHFLSLIERYHLGEHTPRVKTLKQAYQRFQEVVDSPSEQKKLDKAFQKQTGISFYRTMQNL